MTVCTQSKLKTNVDNINHSNATAIIICIVISVFECIVQVYLLCYIVIKIYIVIELNTLNGPLIVQRLSQHYTDD